MTEVQPIQSNDKDRGASGGPFSLPPRDHQSVLPDQQGAVTQPQTKGGPAKTASGVVIDPNDPRFMARDGQGRLLNPDGSVYVPEDAADKRTVQHALGDLESEINHVWHATPSGTETSTLRLRGLLREIRGFVDPNSQQAKDDAKRKQEAKVARDQANRDLSENADRRDIMSSKPSDKDEAKRLQDAQRKIADEHAADDVRAREARAAEDRKAELVKAQEVERERQAAEQARVAADADRARAAGQAPQTGRP